MYYSPLIKPPENILFKVEREINGKTEKYNILADSVEEANTIAVDMSPFKSENAFVIEAVK